MEYFFILGRNPELSRAEVYAYLDSRKIGFRNIFFEGNILILDLEREFSFDIQSFGGLLGLGKLIKFRGKKEFLDYLERAEFVLLDKFRYSVLGNMDSFIFSEKFKKDRKKAQIRTAGRRLNLQSGESISIPSTDVEIFAQSIGSNIFLGMTEQKFSSKESERRDMGKPVRRESLAISPRLAKILINISGAKEGETVLDPFCGIGGVVQEAVLLGINCVGIDRDSSAILGARKNLSWLESNYTIKAKYELLNMNSLNIQDGQYDAIVGESSLGEILKRKLSKGQAQEYLESFQKNIIPLLIKFRKIKKPGARIAMTFPVFEEAQIDITNLLACTGLELVSLNGVDFKIVEKRPEQFVHRQIVVFV